MLDNQARKERAAYLAAFYDATGFVPPGAFRALDRTISREPVQTSLLEPARPIYEGLPPTIPLFRP